MKNAFRILIMILILMSCDKMSPLFTLTTSVTPGGGYISMLRSGNTVTFYAIPAEHYNFIRWAGSIGGNTNPIMVTVNSNLNVSAVFEKKTYPFTVTVEGEGTVTVEAITTKTTNPTHGTTVRLTPVPNEGWEFAEWTGDLTGNENPAEVTVTQSTNIGCTFVQKKSYPLNMTVTGNGSVTEEVITLKSTSYVDGTTVELTPVADEGWEFVEWTGDLTGNTNPAQVTITDTTNITCVFQEKSYSVNFTIVGNGTATDMIDNIKSNSYEDGTRIRIDADPDEGWGFVGWTGDITSTNKTERFTITEPMNITCTFQPDADGDGVSDELDQCPNTPNDWWVTVDENGCADSQKDTDGDGVMDDVDSCPDTPSGENVDGNGCSLSQKTYVPDNNFEQKLINLGYDDILDDYVRTSNIEDVTYLSIQYLNISDLTGIEDFAALEELNIGGNNFTSINLSNNLNLTELDCRWIGLTSLDVSNNTKLNKLLCDNNQFTSLDVSSNISLATLECYSNGLTSLDISSNTNLTKLYCYNNPLNSLDVSSNINLATLYCYNNQLTSLDLSNNVNLETLYCLKNPLTGLDVSNNINLGILNCEDNQLTSLDVSNNANLVYLGCVDNELTSLDVSNNVNLVRLFCDENHLTSLDLSSNVSLQYVNCSDNKLTGLDVDNNINLISLSCKDNQLTSLDVSNNTILNWLSCQNNSLTCIQVNQTQINSIPAGWTKDAGAGYSLDCSPPPPF